MNKEFLNTIKKVHFIGIGGIGISAAARMMVVKGAHVTGNDLEEFPMVAALRDLGVDTKIGTDNSLIPTDTDLIVYSIAWTTLAPQLLEYAKSLGVPMLTYPEMLGKISEGLRTIAISGTHGKTTTTAMTAEVLVGAGKSPNVIVGSLLKSGSNFIPGTSDIFVVEACEYKRSFLNLSPEILVITNIDNDHLDYYKDLDDIISAFRALAMKVSATGVVVADMSNEPTRRALEGISATVVDYSVLEPDAALTLAVSGDHNQRNARAVLAVATILGISKEDTLKHLADFQGTWRRQEFKGETDSGAIVYDDYGHHPAEIRATLQGFRAKFPNRTIRVVFQPHLYSRTKLLLNDFAKSFSEVNDVVLAPIYAAREELDPSITSDMLAVAINAEHVPARALSEFFAIETYLRTATQKGDIVITMGAGDIHKVGEALLS